MLMRRAVVAFRERRALAGLAFARGRAAACDAAVEGAGLDLLLDESDRRRDAFLHRPCDLSLNRDREVTADVLEEGSVRLGEVEGIRGEPLHRLLTVGEHLTAILQTLGGCDVRVDQILDRPVDGSRVLIHAVTKLADALVHRESYPLRVKWSKTFIKDRKS